MYNALQSLQDRFRFLRNTGSWCCTFLSIKYFRIQDRFFCLFSRHSLPACPLIWILRYNELSCLLWYSLSLILSNDVMVVYLKAVISYWKLQFVISRLFYNEADFGDHKQAYGLYLPNCLSNMNGNLKTSQNAQYQIWKQMWCIKSSENQGMGQRLLMLEHCLSTITVPLFKWVLATCQGNLKSG